MKAIVMAGGSGKRLGLGEKPMVSVAGKPMIDHVLANLESSERIHEIFILTSPKTPETSLYVHKRGYNVIETSGRGYVEDLQEILTYFEKSGINEPLLVINADLPLVSGETIDWIVSEYEFSDKPAMCVAVPPEFCRENGIDVPDSAGAPVPSGVNILMSRNRIQDEKILEVSMLELALNINTSGDLKVLRKILGEMDGRKEIDKRGRKVLE